MLTAPPPPPLSLSIINACLFFIVGVDFKIKYLPTQNIKLTLWDTAGQERFRTLTTAYYRGADGIMLVYDVTDRQSFDDLKSVWRQEIEMYCDLDGLVVMVVANKIDVPWDPLTDPLYSPTRFTCCPFYFPPCRR